jgi:cell division protein FtsB
VRKILFPAVILLALYFAVFGGEYRMGDVRRAHAQADQARAERAELEAETTRLEARVDALEHDPRALEALARERFGLIRPGEVLYRFADGGEATPDEVDTDPRER